MHIDWYIKIVEENPLNLNIAERKWITLFRIEEEKNRESKEKILIW